MNADGGNAGRRKVTATELNKKFPNKKSRPIPAKSTKAKTPSKIKVTATKVKPATPAKSKPATPAKPTSQDKTAKAKASVKKPAASPKNTTDGKKDVKTSQPLVRSFILLHVP